MRKVDSRILHHLLNDKYALVTRYGVYASYKTKKYLYCLLSTTNSGLHIKRKNLTTNKYENMGV